MFSDSYDLIFWVFLCVQANATLPLQFLLHASDPPSALTLSSPTYRHPAPLGLVHTFRFSTGRELTGRASAQLETLKHLRF